MDGAELPEGNAPKEKVRVPSAVTLDPLLLSFQLLVGQLFIQLFIELPALFK